MKSKTVNIEKFTDIVYITFPKLIETGVVRHIFSTRAGGVSSGMYSAMNLSFRNGDVQENVYKNYEKLCSAVGINVDNLVLSRQKHTNNVVCVTKNDCGTGYNKPSFEDVDGLITNESGVALVTQFADCTPLLFCDPVKKVIANSHSGWRGTVKQIGKVTVEKMVKQYGCNPADIVAAIGPCICKSCYEVDDLVYDEFNKAGLLSEGVFTKKPNGKYMLDLRLANKNILFSSGIREENIDIADICTCCNADMLHSHRATAGKRGNLAAIIELI